jgi:DNA mismatch repair protein MutS
MATKSTKTAKSKETPLMRQYFEIKAQQPDAILLFRVGDFYETFGEDAVKAARVLGIILTNRNNGGSKIELAGFPYHSLDVYLPKLVKAGYRVAVCEQLEKPSKEKKIVKRGISEIVTPGVAFSDDLLDHRRNNFLCAIHFISDKKTGMAVTDVSTGEFIVHQGPEDELKRLVTKLRPAEIICSREHVERLASLLGEDLFYYHLEPWIFTQQFAIDRLHQHFKVEGMKGYGVQDLTEAQVAAGAILEYLGQTQNDGLTHINNIQRIHMGETVWLDDFTTRNLELVSGQQAGSLTLKEVIDKTITPMGARLLEKYILFPLIDVARINKRLQIVEFFVEHDLLREQVQEQLRQVADLERLAAKIPHQRINPREIVQLKVSLEKCAGIKELLSKSDLSTVQGLKDGFMDGQHVIDAIQATLEDEPPVQVSKGNVIRSGKNKELDELRNLIQHSQELLADIQQVEAERTGITSLKIGYNNVFGYYLEVTNKYKNKGLIPENWVRKQTLTGSERYITDELKQLEEKILGAREKIGDLEEKLFNDLCLYLQDHIAIVQTNAKKIAEADVYSSLAEIAISHQYVKPEVNDSQVVHIEEGRHPVIEQTLPSGEPYIANDVQLDPEDTQIMMITGPNMSGKSALLRQTALIVLMAQMGSFVPARRAEIGIVDKIFTRVGASDNLSSGESTFMVEMNETSSIMNNLSNRSLILLDEIGRGTSTFDGISIAWALAEFVHDHPEHRAKTLFATHYHELNELADRHERIKNFNVSTKQMGQKVIFLRKLVPGGAEHSFGIHVARMAGMPRDILRRAQEILKVLEAQSVEGRADTSAISQPLQLNMFDATDKQMEALRAEVKDLDLNAMTPIECMLKIAEWKKRLLEDS